MSKKIKNEQKKFLGETLNQYDKALDEGIAQLDKKNREQNHKISSLVNSFDNEYLEKDIEGNMTTLENSKDGMVIINEIQGSTEVNYCKDGEKELILNGDIDTQGKSFVTITEGVDGGLVDVSLEGNTEVNLSSTKDPVLVTREFDDINCNSGKLQYTIDDVTTINDEPGKVDIDRIVGDTMVNHAVNGSEELILNAHIDESGDNNITLNGVTSDGGKVDVSLEGNTLVNVSKTKDSTAITKSYTVENSGNHIALQGDIDGSCRPVVTGNTLWIDNATEEVLTAFDETKNLRLQSTFEDNLVTQEMIDNGEEVADNLGKYKVEYKSIREDGTVGSIKTLYLNSPLLEGDTIEEKDGSIYHVHRYTKVVLDGVSNSGMSMYPSKESNSDNTMLKVAYTRGDIKTADGAVYDNSLCDKLYWKPDIAGSANDTPCYGRSVENWKLLINIPLTINSDEAINTYLQSNPLTFVLPLEIPQYELIEQSNLAIPSYANGHLDFSAAVPVEKVEFKPFSEELTYLYPSTSYTVQFVSDKATTADITLGGTSLLAQNIVAGLNRISITTPSELVDNKLIINGNDTGANISEVVVTDTDREFGYFEGMKSVGECEDLEVTSANSDNSLSNAQQLTHEPLRSTGEVKDKYVLLDGKWYIERNCAKATVDDLIFFFGVTFSEYNTTSFVVGLRIGNEYKKHGKCKCNAIKYTNYSDYHEYVDFDYISLWFDTTAFCVGQIRGLSTLDDVQQYFRDNNVVIIYPLATPTYEEIDYNPFDTYADITNISVNSSIPCNITVKNHGYNLVALKENTQYTLYVNKNTTNALTYRLGDYVEINSSNKFTFTTPSTLTDKTLRIDSKGAKVNDLMLIEGTPTNDSIGYFDGLKSSYECEQVTDENDVNYGKYKIDVKVVGKNLFNKSLAPSNGNTGMINVKPNTTYYFYGENHMDNGALAWLSEFDSHGNRVALSTIWTDRFTTSQSTKKIILNANVSIIDSVVLSLTPATEYEPYFESKQTIYLNSPLLKGDEIVWKDNKIQHYHKMKAIVFDGSDDEKWNLTSNPSTNTTRFRIKVTPTCYGGLSGYCDKFNVLVNTEPIDMESIYLDNSFTIRILNSKLQTKDVAGFKQWLQQNPTTVVYKLTEPYYEEISVYPLKLNAIANSSLSTESTIQVTNISFNVYEETLPYLYSNTKYYITFNADVDRNNIVIDLGGSHTVFDCKVGFNKVEITTPSDTTNSLTFSGTGVNIDHVKVTQQDIDEYFEGMKSVGECEELEITSANSDNTLLNSQQLTHEPLRAVGNIKDKYVIIDGKWYIERNCGEVALENIPWEYNETITNSGNTFAYTGGIANILVQKESNKNYFLCNIVEPEKVYNHEVDKEQITQFIHSGAVTLRISRAKLQDNSVNSLKEYLSNNNAKLVYQLETPVYEPIDYNPFDTYADTTHITTNSLIPTNVVVKNHGYNCILKPSTKYTVALNKPNGTISAKLGGSAKVDSTNSIFTITTPDTLNDNVLRLSGSGNVKDIMILEGDKTVNTPSYFEGIESVFEQEYDTEKGKYRVTAKVEGNGKESSIIFYINEPLRGTGTAKDKIFIQDGKVIVERNCSSITLDGSKNIHKANTDFDSVNNISFSIDIDNITSSWVNCNNIVCSTLPNVGNRTWKGNMEGITSNDIIILLCISRNKLQTQDVNGFKQWLQANPTKVVYVLAEPVYEEADCDLSKLVLENYENSSLIFESNIPVSANIKYSGEVPVVTQAKTLSSKVDNTTLDINENIIPYMCDIDYRIVELQLMNGDTQGEGIELLGIGDIEILGNENVLFNNREDKKHNFSYDMLKRDILSQRYSKEEYRYRLDRYLLANKISDEEYKELEGLLNNGE